LEGQVPGLSAFVTPASEFYRIDTALVVPRVDPSSWTLTVDGMVDHPFSIGWDELLALEPVENAVTLACVSNDVGGPYIGSARWLGVRTSELLARAGVRVGADQVLSTSQDGFTVSTPLAALTDGREALVAYGMNGAALPVERGYPVRLLTPGLYGFVGATKWLVKMTVTTYATAPAYWTVRGWSTLGHIKPSSRIEVPRDRAPVRAGTVRVGGTAWAHGAGVGAVQVRVDRGPWQDATLGPDAGVEFWRQWLFDWDAVPGEHVLQVRVVDGAGVPQSEDIVPPFPGGSSGLHQVSVVVS
jgi:DMSO/TMAO reductase YedYZ molybdopterin-dependent catalytic subunit